MRLFAKFMYRALVWKERQRARMAQRTLNRQTSANSGRVLGHPALHSAGLSVPPHLETGRRGETLAYWYLRQAGYTIVARNLLSDSRAGELDLVAWDGAVLAFVEVKTRSSLNAGQPEAAVSSKKQRRVARTAKEYMRRLRRKALSYRFDTVSVLWDANSGYHVRLTKDAFKG
jgi:putative endonuclease